MLKQAPRVPFGPRGIVESADSDRLAGWAHDATRPFRRLAIVGTDETGRSVRAVADIYRADLQQAGLGDGHAGFSLPLRLFPDAHVLTVTFEASGRSLEGSPYALRTEVQAEEGQAGRFAFALDPAHLSGLRRTGWVIDRDEPERSVRVALRSGDRIVAEARACRFRPDLAARDLEAFHGFHLEWSAALAAPLMLHDARSGVSIARLR